MNKENLLIIGGCHVINEQFVSEIKKYYHFTSTKKFFTHIPDENFNKIIQYLEKEYNQLNKNYNIIIQIGNIHYHNSITNILPNSLTKIILSKLKIENSFSKNEETSNNNYYSKLSLTQILTKFLRIFMKVLVFPFNLIYVPIKGFFVFQKLKRIIKNSYYQNEIVIFTPMKTRNNIDNFFKRIGVSTIKITFNNLSNVKVFDFYNLDYKPNFYKDTYHLNDEGIKYYLEIFENQNMFSKN